MKDSSFFVAGMLDVPGLFGGILCKSVDSNCVVCGSEVLHKFFKIDVRRGQNESPRYKAMTL